MQGVQSGPVWVVLGLSEAKPYWSLANPSGAGRTEIVLPRAVWNKAIGPDGINPDNKPDGVLRGGLHLN